MSNQTKQEVDAKIVVEEQKNEMAPEKTTIYRVAYNTHGEFHGFDYYLSKVNAHWSAEREEGTGSKTRVDEIEIELSPKGICDALNEYAIATGPGWIRLMVSRKGLSWAECYLAGLERAPGREGEGQTSRIFWQLSRGGCIRPRE